MPIETGNCWFLSKCTEVQPWARVVDEVKRLIAECLLSEEDLQSNSELVDPIDPRSEAW